MNNRSKTEINKIEIPDELDTRIKSGIKMANKERQSDDKKYSSISNDKIVPKKRKIAYTVGAVLILLLLFLNSFYSYKTIITYAAELPVISDIFNLEPLSELIYVELEENDYDLDYIDIQISFFSGKEITITIGGTANYQEAIKDEMKKTVEMFLIKEGYDTFQVNVNKQKESDDYKLSFAQQKEKKIMESEIKGLLSKLKVSFEYIAVEPLDKKIFVQISTSKNGEKYLKEYSQFVKDELKNVTDYNRYEFHVMASGSNMLVGNTSSFSALTDLDKNITKLVRILTENKKYKVIGFSYESDPLIFEIRTSLGSSDREKGKYLEGIINDYFQSTDIAPSLKGKSYKVIIYSEDQEQIN